jgi:RNA polymerase sigma factor (sigma-70 family)
MPPPLPGEWPTDADRLAAIAADDGQPPELRDRACQELLPTIRRVARRLALRFAGPHVQDLLDEAAGDVWPALGSYQPGRSFEAWCYGVLRHYLIDRFRRDSRERAHRASLAVGVEVSGLQQALERALDLPGRLPPSDLATLRDWPLTVRLALLALSGLWGKVPPEEWDAWVEEHRTNREGSLPEPFPPGEMEGCDSIAERNAVLSAAMGIPRNTLSVWLYRYKRRLADLYYVRNLLDTL